MEQRIKALELMIQSSHNLVINLNDVFYFACADSGEITGEDAIDLISYVEKYGFEALVAYEAIKRGHDPKNPSVMNDTFLKVKKELEEKMEKDTNFLCDLNYELRKQKTDILELGGVVEYKFIPPSFWQKLKGDKYSTCVAYIKGDKVKGKGRNMFEARQNLKEKKV